MRTLTLLLLAFIVVKTSAAQDITKIKKFYNKEFNWTINIPPNFDTVSAQEWAKLHNKGTEAYEKTYNHNIKTNEATVLFALKNGTSNIFTALSEPFDSKREGSYTKFCKKVDDELYHTLTTQLPHATIDSAIVKTLISNLNFNVFILRAHLSNGLYYSIYSFSRLFGQKEFSVNIMFIDNIKGDIMLDAWKRSTFGSQH